MSHYLLDAPRRPIYRRRNTAGGGMARSVDDQAIATTTAEGSLAPIRNTAGPALPALIAGAGERASWRFVEFFTVNIRNPNTRAAYGRAAGAFLRWCEGQGIASLGEVLPVHVAAYVEQLQAQLSAPTVKQHLACIRMLFDWL